VTLERQNQDKNKSQRFLSNHFNCECLNKWEQMLRSVSVPTADSAGAETNNLIDD
jgi:hypothetical protein